MQRRMLTRNEPPESHRRTAKNHRELACSSAKTPFISALHSHIASLTDPF